MNILEKFLELFNKCIIILSGFEQLHLSEYAKKLAENFNFDLINFDYPNYDNLNEIVKNNKNKGLVIYGLSFEKDLIKFRPSIHISLSGPKHIIKDDEKYKHHSSKSLYLSNNQIDLNNLEKSLYDFYNSKDAPETLELIGKGNRCVPNMNDEVSNDDNINGSLSANIEGCNFLSG